MAPSLREIRQAMTRKRRVRTNGAPAERRAVAKAARRTEAGRAEAAESLCEHEAAGAQTDGAVRAEAGEELGQNEAGERDLPRSPSPGAPPPQVVLIDVSPEGDVKASSPPPEDVEAEPVRSTTKSAPETALPSTGAAAEASSPAKGLEGAEAETESSSAAARPTEGNGIDPSFQSILLHHSRWAQQTMHQVSVPELQGFLRQQGRSEFFREMFVAHLWAVNSAIAMRGTWVQAEAALDQAFEEMGALRSRAERAEMALEDTRAATARALEAKIETLRLRVEKTEDALEVAQRQAANELDNAQVAEEKQKVAEEKLQAVESEVCMLKNQLHSATIKIGVAEERAEHAEEIARQSNAKIVSLTAAVTEAEKKMVEGEQKIAEAAQKVSEAERRATEAVEEFRKSAAYNRELAESTSFAYEGGFQECKEKIQKLYGLEGIEKLQPDEVSEDDDSPR